MCSGGDDGELYEGVFSGGQEEERQEGAFHPKPFCVLWAMFCLGGLRLGASVGGVR